MALKVVMHEALPMDDVEAIKRLVLEHDESAEVSANYVTKAIDPVLLVMIVGGLFLQGFFTRAGEDAYEGLKRFVQRLRSDVTSDIQLVLDDEDLGLQLILGPSTPAEALLDLPEDLRKAAAEAGELYWDGEERCWKAPF